ncbi:MAG: UTP--glucose-1-phosphate uridylyltransferase [Candidatus Omnitrophica bacterium]|nr:UTP--glucose-1-phosphate uridylyltransferase [Candidatus Omnitrophota bacterium]
MSGEKIHRFLKEHRQEHIIRHIELLDKNEKDIFIKNLNTMNLELAFQLYENFSKPEEVKTYKEITPPYIVDIEKYKKEKEMLSIGENSIKAGETAVMIVAGGQGSRLGYPYPKGMYPISPVKGKSLFQIATEKVLALSLKYKINIPLLIMTNPETKEMIENFFNGNNYFGLTKECIFFFNQDILPSITPDGKLIIKEKTSIFANPDGHGGSLKAIWQSGLLDRMEKQGIKRIFYCHIDNPLVNVNDPVFLGWHIKEGAEFSLKVVKKREPEEKVGHFVISDGKPTIIEYIEFPDELKYKKDINGNLIFWAGSIGIHFIETSFIRKINKDGFALPYHRQVKKTKIDNEEKEIWKFETFVFDAIPLADKVCCVETIREDEFAPLKNKEGEDSPEEVKKAMMNFYRKKLEELGIYVSSDVKVEVSPLCNIDVIAKGLKDKEIT